MSLIKSHITNTALLSYDKSEWFPIFQDGEWTNRSEFVSMQMKEYNLKTPILVNRALATINI